MDVCCLNRPFDNLAQECVQFESDAVLSILSRCRSGEWTLALSEVVDLELEKQTDANRLRKVRALCSVSSERLILNDNAVKRALEFQQFGIKTLDSLHLAVADSGGVDVFLTTDDRFLRSAQRFGLTMKIANPVTWLMEVLQNE
jgi:predicted nucleic acid-binding protein